VVSAEALCDYDYSIVIALQEMYADECGGEAMSAESLEHFAAFMLE
jgi:hypothetical protein